MRVYLRIAFLLIIPIFFTAALVAEPPPARGTVRKKQASSASSKKAKKDAFGKRMDKLDKQYTATPGQSSAPGGLGTFIETILILSLFVLGIYGVFRFVQKKRGTTVSAESTIRMLSSLSVGGSRMLQIVEVGNQLFFIGVADSSINLIAEISDKETIDWIKMEYSKEQASGNEGFLEKLFAMLGKSGAPISNAENDRKVDFLRKQKERLRKMKDK